MTASVVLDNGVLRLEVAPELGGSILRLDRVDRGRPLPVLRPWAGNAENATDRAMFLMAPWCNRISGAGLPWAGRSWDLPRLVPGQEFPIHGTVLHLGWELRAQTGDSLCLAVADSRVPPFRFELTLDYRLSGAALTVHMALRHTGRDPAPYGLGFHPWLARGADDRLEFHATGFAEEDDRRLPVRLVGYDAAEAVFDVPRALPEGLGNGTYTGWRGRAVLHRAAGDRIEVISGAPTGALHVFSRAADCGFVCLEPVSHTVDSPHRPLVPELTLKPLVQGQRMRAAMTISVHDRASPDLSGSAGL